MYRVCIKPLLNEICWARPQRVTSYFRPFPALLVVYGFTRCHRDELQAETVTEVWCIVNVFRCRPQINSSFLLSSLYLKTLHRASSSLSHHQFNTDIFQVNVKKKITKKTRKPKHAHLLISVKYPKESGFPTEEKNNIYYCFLTSCPSEVSTAILFCPFSYFSWIHYLSTAWRTMYFFKTQTLLRKPKQSELQMAHSLSSPVTSLTVFLIEE